MPTASVPQAAFSVVLRTDSPGSEAAFCSGQTLRLRGVGADTEQEARMLTPAQENNGWKELRMIKIKWMISVIHWSPLSFCGG